MWKINDMLILTRKLNEEIKIGNDILVKVISISENNVKIGIEAPKGVQIIRSELYDKVIEVSSLATKQSKLELKGLTKLKIKKIE